MRLYVRILLGMLAMGLCSCGGSDGNNGGGIITPATVYLDSDVAIWTGTPCGVSSTYVVKPDDVNVTLNAFPAPPGSTGVTPEKILVESVMISYSPASSGAPALQSQFATYQGQQVDLGSSLSLPVRIVPLDLKMNVPLSNLICTNTNYSYYANMTFNCRYLIADKTFTMTSQINVRFADFAN